MAPQWDVAVVGAGPVGLALALALARAGRRVVVLEKQAGTSERSRAPAIWLRTQEVLDGLGVLPRFLERGIALRRIELVDVDRQRPLLRLDLGELAGQTTFPQLLIVPQSRTEGLLREELEREPTAELLFACEVLDLEERDGGVRLRCRDLQGERSVDARLAVGCDGAHSTVRAAIGAELEGATYPLRAALADVVPRAAGELGFPRLTTREGLAVAIRIDAQLWRLILPFAEGEESELEARIARAVQRLFPAPEHELVWRSEFRLHRRLATTLARGRVALAGDAAHLNSPVGGQGMNAGIQDAEDLAPRLVEALERDDPAPLQEYAGERRRAAAAVNAFTHRLTRVLLLRRALPLPLALRAASLALRVPALRRRVLRRIAMLDAKA